LKSWPKAIQWDFGNFPRRDAEGTDGEAARAAHPIHREGGISLALFDGFVVPMPHLK
jgi:hypothetical protein